MIAGCMKSGCTLICAGNRLELSGEFVLASFARRSLEDWQVVEQSTALIMSQQPISPIGFLFLKLPPPPCAVLLVTKVMTISLICTIPKTNTESNWTLMGLEDEFGFLSWFIDILSSRKLSKFQQQGAVKVSFLVHEKSILRFFSLPQKKPSRKKPTTFGGSRKSIEKKIQWGFPCGPFFFVERWRSTWTPPLKINECRPWKGNEISKGSRIVNQVPSFFRGKLLVFCGVSNRTRWAHTSYKCSYSPYKWPYKWVSLGL